MSAPEISVVIPTLNRETRVAFALEALAAQTLDRDRFEVIVVRAPDGPAGHLTQAPPDLDVQFLRSEITGPAAQRNVGWRAATGRLIAFTDDDCRPEPDWLEQLLAAEAGDQTILQGMTLVDPEERHLLHGFARSMEVYEPDRWAPTCNIAYPRALLERVGGFDESFTDAWGEDTDLALRSIESGANQVWVHEALVHHAVLPRRLSGALSDAVRRSNIHIVLVRHPSQRRELDMRLFTKRRHAWVLLGLAGLPFARRLPLLAIAAWIPWLRTYDPGPGWTVARVAWWFGIFLPRHLLVDATELGAMAASSVKYRTPVL